ncbi:MAG: hypothetical protein H0T73_00135 [Ardenticatenales bacterium]|nr:hypothetical protein [Ardenticatenales bacterium]
MGGSEFGMVVLDPFVGTGNFLLRVMQEIPRSRLAQKYGGELHCNEVMLLPYYIASMNIEHLFYELTGEYKPFEGICLVDTFELAKGRQMRLLVAENTERVLRQQAQDIFIIIGNPPYNVGQVNENDNNKNRRYEVVDKRVAESYAKGSAATNKNALSDAYVKAFRWASDRIGEEGVVAFVTNNGFVDGLAFDGMRKHLAQDFDAIYILDLGGNVRKNPRLSGTTHNVFGIQVGVSIAFLVRRKGEAGKRNAEIFYSTVGEEWRKEEKYSFLERAQDILQTIEERHRIEPNPKHTWLMEGLQSNFDEFLPMGSKDAKAGRGDEAIFANYSPGLQANRDVWVYNFSANMLRENVQLFIESYNGEVNRWHTRSDRQADLDSFVLADANKIKWSSNLKGYLRQHRFATFAEDKIRTSLYRPFTRQHLFFDEILNHRQGQWPSFFPTPETEQSNRVIWLKVGAAWPMFALMVDRIADLLPESGSQCFPLYTYDEDGGNRRDNITDWALQGFRAHYSDERIGKLDIFHYVYALLHHPAYRERYAANLRRDLPRLPFAPEFWPFARAGERLAHLHVHYEAQPEYPLQWIESPNAPLDWRAEKLRLSKDKTQLRYNDFLTLSGIPETAYAYRLGNRSALEWVIDQYQVSTDKRSGITNDPNRADDPQYIVRLIGQVITVSMETVEIVQGLGPLEG